VTIARHIVISDQAHELPYSKGVMAGSIMATGLSPARAFHVAELVEERLHAAGVASLTRAELHEQARLVLQEKVGERYASAFANWQRLHELGMPLIILIGGATGVGKSTIATQLAARLGITRVIPTDAIREVMRAMLSDDLLPALHASSFDTDRLVLKPVPRNADPVVIGYREQAAAVAVGIKALARRAIMEGTHLVLEGAHIAPGFVDLDEVEGAVVVSFLVTVDDEDLHRSHLIGRSRDARGRPVDRYLDHFDHIRTIQRYVTSLAREHGMPIIPSYSLDATLSQAIELVLSRALAVVPSPQPVP
jgi:2-phosphoglycerate kinase